MAKFPSEDHAAVSTAAAAVLASATDVEEGNSPPWRPDDEYAPKILPDGISVRSALSSPRNDGR